MLSQSPVLGQDLRDSDSFELMDMKSNPGSHTKQNSSKKAWRHFLNIQGYLGVRSA